METRALGNTGINLPVLSYGASSLGAEFRRIDINEALNAVRTAFDLGMNYVDTSPFYGRGMSECLLGTVLQDMKRDDFILSTKLGRYSSTHFDFSARRVAESIDISLERLKVDHIDLIVCHDIEFVEMQQIVDETLPAVREAQKAGKVKHVGISGYPMKAFEFVLEQTELDFVLSYNHYTMQNTMFGEMAPYLKRKGAGLINASPFAARLLANAPLPEWHRATPEVREVAEKARKHCEDNGVDIGQLAVQFSIANKDMSTCMIGSANPKNVKKWVEWAEAPVNQQLMDEVIEILKPIHNWRHIEGKAENNEPQGDWQAPS